MPTTPRTIGETPCLRTYRTDQVVQPFKYVQAVGLFIFGLEGLKNRPTRTGIKGRVGILKPDLGFSSVLLPNGCYRGNTHHGNGPDTSAFLRLSVYNWRGMGLAMAQPRRRLWQSAAGQAVVGPCPPRAVEGPSRSVVATVFSYVLHGYVSVQARMTSTGAGKMPEFSRRC